MNVEQVTSVFGWMLLINGILLIIGFLKITFLNTEVKWMCDAIFGDRSEAVYQVIPRIVFNFEILIVVFNMVPYVALKITF